MKEFKCVNLRGNGCNWKHIAGTEELLADMVALHLREAHGMQELSPEMVGKIKNTFTNPSPEDIARVEGMIPEDERPVMKEFLCKDLGTDCSWHYLAQTEELIADGVAMHAREAHGIQEFSPEMALKVKRLAHEWKG